MPRTRVTMRRAKPFREPIGALKAKELSAFATRRTRPTGCSSRDVFALLQESNKLVFVQDFEGAATKLTELSRRYEHLSEIHFRRIEVAYRTGEIDVVADDYQERLKHHYSLVLEFASTLAQIRKHERDIETTQPETQVINPSFREFSGEKNLIGLTSTNEVEQAQKYLPPPQNRLSFLESSSTTLKISRHPLVPDDHPIMEPPQAKEASADGEEITETSNDPRMKLECVANARRMALEYSDRHESWFILGCAYELVGNLSDAVECWLRSEKHNSKSLAVLATLAELQQMGVLPENGEDYTQRFELLDRYLVHGSLETHLQLYKEFIASRQYNMAVIALRTLADWLQKQRGEVQPEIEILCLMGAMKAYDCTGNASARDACRHEVETLTAACTRSPIEYKQLKFIGEMSEQFGLIKLARLCYTAILVTAETPSDIIVQTAVHAVSLGFAPNLKDALRIAYRNSHGHPEVRFCQVLCALSQNARSIPDYMARKAKIREKLSQGNTEEGFPLLQSALLDTTEDPEIHYYLAEILSRVGSEKAEEHFEAMYRLDNLNVDSVIRYIYVLLKKGDYDRVHHLTEEMLAPQIFTEAQSAELCWAKATALFALGAAKEAREAIQISISLEPWNSSYLTLAMRLHTPTEQTTLMIHEQLCHEFEEYFLKNKAPENEYAWERLLAQGNAALTAGYVDYAFLIAKSTFILGHRFQNVVEFFSRAAAAYNSRIGVQQLLRLLNVGSPENAFPLSHLASFAAQVYSQAGEWSLVDEWIDISNKSGLEDRYMRTKLLEMEALKLAMQGQNLRKAQNLVEAAIDLYESEKRVSHDVGVLHGYLLLIQGETKVGMEKMEHHIQDHPSIQNLYFLIKGLERSGAPQRKKRETLTKLFSLAPASALERRLIEEIYISSGQTAPGISIPLAC